MSVEAVKNGLVKTGFSETTEIAGTAEIGMTAAAAQAKGMVEARFIMAMRNPRKLDKVRQDCLKEFARPALANDPSAIYRLPRGNKFIEGLGIRAAEVLARCMTNMQNDAIVLQESDAVRTVLVFSLDIESNTSYSGTIQIKKMVERSTPMENGDHFGVRLNSNGDPVYTVPATDNDLKLKEAAEVSKMMRTLILRLVPGDIQDDAEKLIREVRTKGIKDDPDGAKKKIIDAFALQNVSVTDLEAFLEHSVEKCTPAEIENLQGLYGGLRDGEFTWGQILEHADEMRKVKPKTKAPKETAETATTTTTPTKGVDATKNKVEEQKNKAATATKPAATAPPAEKPKPVAVPTPEPVVVAPPAPAPEPPPSPVEEAAAPPAWATEAIDAEVTIEPEPEVEIVVAAAPQRKLGRPIKGQQFYEDTTEGEPHTPEELAAAVAEAKRVGTSLEKTIKDWFKVELKDFDGDSMRKITEVLKTFPTKKTA